MTGLRGPPASRAAAAGPRPREAGPRPMETAMAVHGAPEMRGAPERTPKRFADGAPGSGLRGAPPTTVGVDASKASRARGARDGRGLKQNKKGNSDKKGNGGGGGGGGKKQQQGGNKQNDGNRNENATTEKSENDDKNKNDGKKEGTNDDGKHDGPKDAKATEGKKDGKNDGKKNDNKQDEAKKDDKKKQVDNKEHKQDKNKGEGAAKHEPNPAGNDKPQKQAEEKGQDDKQKQANEKVTEEHAAEDEGGKHKKGGTKAGGEAKVGDATGAIEGEDAAGEDNSKGGVAEDAEGGHNSEAPTNDQYDDDDDDDDDGGGNNASVRTKDEDDSLLMEDEDEKEEGDAGEESNNDEASDASTNNQNGASKIGAEEKVGSDDPSKKHPAEALETEVEERGTVDAAKAGGDADGSGEEDVPAHSPADPATGGANEAPEGAAADHSDEAKAGAGDDDGGGDKSDGDHGSGKTDGGIDGVDENAPATIANGGANDAPSSDAKKSKEEAEDGSKDEASDKKEEGEGAETAAEEVGSETAAEGDASVEGEVQDEASDDEDVTAPEGDGAAGEDMAPAQKEASNHGSHDGTEGGEDGTAAVEADVEVAPVDDEMAGVASAVEEGSASSDEEPAVEVAPAVDEPPSADEKEDAADEEEGADDEDGAASKAAVEDELVDEDEAAEAATETGGQTAPSKSADEGEDQTKISKSADDGMENEDKAESAESASADVAPKGNAKDEEAAAAAKPDLGENLEEQLEGTIESSDGPQKGKDADREKVEAKTVSKWGDDDDDDVADTEGSDLKAYEEANAASDSEGPKGSVGSSEGPDEDEVDGAASGGAKQASEWGDDDDDDNVSAVAAESDTATGNKGSMSSDKAIESDEEEGAEDKLGESEVMPKTEAQIESKIESEIEQALEDGELDEDTAEELEEEMEEALEEGVGEVFEEKLEEQLGQGSNDSDDEVEEPSSSDAVKDTGAGSGGVATIGLSYDKAGSTVLVDDPPVIGEAPLRPTGETSADTGGKGTTTEGAAEASLAFENLDCKDEPTGFPKYPGTGSNVRVPCEEMTKETCEKVLFSVDLAAPAANVRVEEEITPEESPKDLHNDAKDDERRKLVWSEDSEDDANQKADGGWGEESLDQEANLNAPSLLAEKATLASDKLVVTFGSRYCPATCDALAQCTRARDHFNPAESSNQVDKDASEDEDALSENQDKPVDNGPSGDELEESSDAKALASGDGIDLADRTSADATAADKAEDIAEGVGEETVDEGMVATAPTCEDDPSFLYKLKPGMDCAYIGKYKPDKCQKLHDGEKVGVESCPVSCGMVEECETKLGVSAPLDDETIGSEDDEVAVSGEVTGLNDVVVEDQEDVDEIGDNNAPAEPTGDAAAVAEVVCEDDPDFLYKLKAGMDCEYIGKYKADKCLKLHDGVTVGASSCPQSCNMVKECKEMFNLAGGVSELVSDGSGDGVVDTVVEEGGEAESAELGEGGDEDGKDMNSAVFGSEVEETEETGTADDEGDNVPYSSGEPRDEDNAIEVDEPNVLSTGEGQEPEQEQTDVGYLNNENAWSADSEDAPPSAVSSDDSTRCKDDPAFRYKDREEETCQYIGKTNPQKCAKLHNGVEIGISSCPESCGMVAKCLGGSEQDIAETGTADGGGDIVPNSSSGEPKDEDNAIEIGEPNILSTEEEQEPEEEPEPEEEQTDGGYLSNENAWSADSEDVPPSAVSSDDSARCKDDPAFRYKDREEETCQYIGKTNPQKCAKLHNGVEIGISSCPESCGMVAKCMGEESSVAGEVTEVAVEPDFCKDVPGYRYNGEPERDCAWIQSNVRCEEELEGALASESVVGDTRTIGKFYCAETCGMVAEGCGSAEAGSALSGDEGEDGDGYEDNSLQSPRMGDVGMGDSVDEFQSSYGDATGTKSMADEIDSLGGGSDGAPPEFGSTLGSDDEAGYGKEENMGAMGGEENNGFDDDMRYGADDDDNEQGDGSYQSNNNWEDKNKGWSSWDSNDEEMEGGNDADEMENWAKKNEAKSWDVNDVTGSAVEENGGSNGWEDKWNENWNGVDSNPTTWDANAESIGSASGGADSFNPGQDVGSFVDNSAPLSAPSANSPNDLAPSPADDWDPYADDDGFPTGLFIALLVILGFFVFKKSRDQQEQSQNNSGRGGYQPVRNNSAHNKRW